MMLKIYEGKSIHSNLHKMYMNFCMWNICNLEVYMHIGVCMDQHFDIITNLFKYKCETC
jgi:hypothetical protein